MPSPQPHSLYTPEGEGKEIFLSDLQESSVVLPLASHL
jgi:hypothetical protein